MIHNRAIRYSLTDCSLTSDQRKNKYPSKYQNIPKNYYHRQRHSISTMSPISNNGDNIPKYISKQADKKYDYSVHLQRALGNSLEDINQPQKVSFIVDPNERRWLSSTNQNIPEYLQSQTKQRTSNKQQQNRQSHTSIQSKLQKVDLRENMKLCEQKTKINSKLQTCLLDASKNMNKNQGYSFSNQNCMQGSFNNTGKLKQFRNDQNQEANNRAKYESKYAKMRNKRCQVIMRDQNIINQKSFIRQQLQSNQKEVRQIPINYQNLLKDSKYQNVKIKQKIQRIQKLNQQINNRLQKMLARRNIQ